MRAFEPGRGEAEEVGYYVNADESGSAAWAFRLRGCVIRESCDF